MNYHIFTDPFNTEPFEKGERIQSIEHLEQIITDFIKDYHSKGHIVVYENESHCLELGINKSKLHLFHKDSTGERSSSKSNGKSLSISQEEVKNAFRNFYLGNNEWVKHIDWSPDESIKDFRNGCILLAVMTFGVVVLYFFYHK